MPVARPGSVERRRRGGAGASPALVASSSSRSPSSTTGIVNASARSSVVVAVDVALDEARRRQAARGAVGAAGLEHRARLVAEVAARARVQDEVGEGRGPASALWAGSPDRSSGATRREPHPPYGRASPASSADGRPVRARRPRLRRREARPRSRSSTACPTRRRPSSSTSAAGRQLLGPRPPGHGPAAELPDRPVCLRPVHVRRADRRHRPGVERRAAPRRPARRPTAASSAAGCRGSRRAAT